jgi:hypothetical protein
MMDALEHDNLVYRASHVTRVAAWVVLASTAAVAIWAIGGGGAAAMKPVLVTGLFALLATAALRLGVRADPDQLVICWGGRVRRMPWSDVRGFEVDDRTDRDVFVLLTDKRRERLPVVEVAMRRTSAVEVRTALDAYWRAHRHSRR